MSGFETLAWALLVLGWAVFEIIRRLMRRPRSLGSIEDEAAMPQAPAPAPAARAPLQDMAWGRQAPADRVPGQEGMPSTADRPSRSEPFIWSTDRGQEELGIARDTAARQARQRQHAELAATRRRHPRRPASLHSEQMRDAVVLTTILGPCRADGPYDAPRPRGSR